MALAGYGQGHGLKILVMTQVHPQIVEMCHIV